MKKALAGTRASIAVTSGQPVTHLPAFYPSPPCPIKRSSDEPSSDRATNLGTKDRCRGSGVRIRTRRVQVWARLPHRKPAGDKRR